MMPRNPTTSTRTRLDRDLHGIGRLVLEKGLASRDEVDRCLAIQHQSADSGVFLRLGEIFVREGLLTPEQVQTLLALQHVRIEICVRCFAQFNIEDWSPASDRRCPKCEGPLVEARDLKSLAVEDTVSDVAAREPSLALLDSSIRQFAGHDILGEISRGGMGIVYKARHRELDRIVALKVLLAGGESSQEQVLRFQREARAVARLRHPNIVGIHEIGEHRGIHYFSMDYVAGVSLEQMIGRPEHAREQLLEILTKICDAVYAAHRGGVLHRDIKPSNILVTRDHEPFLIDFGIAHVHDQDVRLTRQGYIFGSPLYMAPEYVSGALRSFNELCDVYALGVVLYQVIAGVTPYEDVETIQVLSRILKDEATPVERVASNVPVDLATICAKAIDKHPSTRYQTAKALADDLRRYLSHEPILARPRPWLLRWWQREQDRILRSVAVLLAVLLLTAAWYVPEFTLGTMEQLDAERLHQQRARDQALRNLAASSIKLLDAADRLAALGDYGTALAILEQLCDQQPGDIGLHERRERLLTVLGRDQDAAAARARIQQLRGDNPDR
jgi:serine/threonine-protein kinase